MGPLTLEPTDQLGPHHDFTEEQLAEYRAATFDPERYPSQRDIYLWVAHHGTDDIERLFKDVMRRQPRVYDFGMYMVAFRIRDPRWVKLLYPLADRKGAKPYVERYLRNEGINAVEGLCRLAASRSARMRKFAYEWLSELAGSPDHHAWILARLPHHPTIQADIEPLLAPTEYASAEDLPGWVNSIENLEVLDWIDVKTLTPACLGALQLSPRLSAKMVSADVETVELARAELSNLEEFTGSLLDQYCEFDGHRKVVHRDRGSKTLGHWQMDEDQRKPTHRFFSTIANDTVVFAIDDIIRTRDMPDEQRSELVYFLGQCDRASARFVLWTLQNQRGVYGAGSMVERSMKQNRWKEWNFRDRAVPGFGLNSHGERDFDYGSRTIRLSIFGAHGVTFTDLSTGKKTKSIPSMKKADNVDKVTQAKHEWKQIKARLSTARTQQIEPLQHYMGKRRAWSPDEWLTFIAGNPVMSAIAGGLVWKALDGDTTLFGWREGETFDINFEPVDLSAFGRVRVCPRDEIDDREKWTQIFMDFEITQPFDQL